MIQFFQTHMGRKFIEGDIPRIAKSLEGIHEELRRANDMSNRNNALADNQQPPKLNGCSVDELAEYMLDVSCHVNYFLDQERLVVFTIREQETILDIRAQDTPDFDKYRSTAKLHGQHFARLLDEELHRADDLAEKEQNSKEDAHQKE